MASRFPSEENVQIRSKLQSSETSTSNHLQSVNDNVNATYDGKLNSAKDKERDEIRLINEEADEEIRIINEKRDKLIEACKKEAKEQQQTLKDSAAKLLSDMKTITEKVKKKINELKSKHQHYTEIVDNVDSKIERMKQDDKALVQEAPQVIAPLDESFSSYIYQEVAGFLDRIEHEIQRVKFVEGEVGGKHYERIDGYIGKWELVKSIDIASIVKKPSLLGSISDDEICVLNFSDRSLYVTNISTEHTEKIIEGDRSMYVRSCASVDSNVIVCGKWRGDCRGDSLDGCITLYDRQWKVIRDITIPSNGLFNTVYVDVERDGMILAAQYSQSNIYVINPADGKIVNTITMKGKGVRDGIHALSSGDIAVKTGWEVFTVVSRSGEEKAVIHCDQWGRITWCYVDKLTDTLYITYEDEESKAYAVDQVSCDGSIQARRIVEYKLSDRSPFNSPCLVTPSGNLVVCDGDNLLVYKKSLIL